MSKRLVKKQAGCTALIDKVTWEVVTCEFPWWLAVKQTNVSLHGSLGFSHHRGFPDYATAMSAEAGMSQSPVSYGFSDRVQLAAVSDSAL